MDAEEEGRVSAPGPTLLFDMEEEGGVSAPSPHLLFDDARIASPSWVYRIYIFLSLATLSQFMLAPISPDIVRAPFHVSMCPNITAAIDHSLTPGGSGYVVTAAQDSGRGLFKLAGAFVAGWACDKIGRKPVMLLGAIGDAVPMFTIAMTCDTAFYIPLNTVMGFFDSFVTVAVATFIADVVPAPERAAAYGRMFVPALVVLLVGSPLIGKLALATMNSNIQLLFTITAALSILPMIFSLCFIPETLGCKIPGDVPVPPVIVPKLPIAGAGDEREEETPGHFSAPQSLLTLALASILFLNFIVSMATGGEQAMLFLYMANNFPECTVECRSFLMSAISITVIFSSLILLPISLRFLRRMWTLRLALVGRVAVLTTLMLARDVDWIFISLSFVLLANFFTIVIMDLAATTAPKDKQGQVQGMLAGTTTLATVLSPPIFAAMFEEYKNSDPPGKPWIIGVVFSAVGLLISLCISTPPREKPPSSSARHPTGREEPLLSDTDRAAPDLERIDEE
mmetsp:Transcript_4700/g.11306  ORF Transcript_4700/g.11306 Transcript_4700/m.11306 type:complete len:511 (+) Transcript_4700:138-1670(+)